MNNRVDKYTNTDADDFAESSRIIYASRTKNIEVQTQPNSVDEIVSPAQQKRQKSEDLSLQVATRGGNGGSNSSSSGSQKACKIDLEYLLKCYLMKEFRKNDVSKLREKLFNLMVFVDSANPSSLHVDNRRFTNFSNGCLIKCLNRNMLLSLNDDKVSSSFLILIFFFK